LTAQSGWLQTKTREYFFQRDDLQTALLQKGVCPQAMTAIVMA